MKNGRVEEEHPNVQALDLIHVYPAILGELTQEPSVPKLVGDQWTHLADIAVVDLILLSQILTELSLIVVGFAEHHGVNIAWVG